MISFIVPAYNEEENIRPVVQTIMAAAKACALDDYEILLIDDGSSDATFAVMDDMQKSCPAVTVIRNPQNFGLGVSVRSGIAAARAPQFMVVPGDNDMSQAFIELLLIFREKAEIILTIPLNKESRSVMRNILSMVYQMLQTVTFNVYVNYINGPGIWPTEKARAVGLNAKRFSIISELNVKLLRSGCSYVELPGYFNARPKIRRTVTLKNLIEVVRMYLTLLYEIRVRRRDEFRSRPQRVQIDFAALGKDQLRLNRKSA